MNSLFIVIEGLDATGKSTLAPKLAHRLGATLLECPPKLEAPNLSPDLRGHFDNRPPNQRRAYYRAANLIASEMAEVALKIGHVVMDRYWPSTVAFAALDRNSDLIQEWQGCYPLEIREPDAVILLTVNEENRRKRMHERGEPVTAEEQKLEDITRCESVLREYRQFQPIEIDTSDCDRDTVLNMVITALRDADIIV